MAVATTLLGGLGTYGAAAFAAPPADPRPAPSATVSTAPGVDAMIRHCTDQLPAGERGAAEKEMREMMTHHGAGNSMMGGSAGNSMMGSGESMTGMMVGATDGAGS
ncbi:hypothetical protein JOF29_000104 [Kribbella aluminosa]|uniref:DUF305 domain-containing protein n=1 Tax=Kribbella aluminosa TaxID=416017 RepID=A0ABS4UBK7_9ACTN|nr:hypothetical protein [Kribbella aluminosa]MBP2349021.1 hypothetical protein [Kribbella aluminosa]